MADEHQAHEEEGEGWLVSYADLVTLLFGLFVMLYAMAEVDDKKFVEMGKSLAAGFKKAPDITSDAPTPPENLLTEEQKQIRAFQMLVAIMNLGDPNSAVRKVSRAYEAALEGKSVANIANGLTGKTKGIEEASNKIDNLSKAREEKVTELILAADEIFQGKSSEFKPQARVTLASVTEMLKKVQDYVDIQVVAHTDADPIPHNLNLDNWALTTNQAMAITRFFIENGIPGNIINAIGKGSFVPLFDEKDDKGNLLIENKAKNRRINIVLEKK